MKKIIFFIMMLFISLAQVWAYSFSAVSPSGHTLYYNLNNGSLSVTYPGNSYYNAYYHFDRPTGDLVVPASINYAGTEYPVTGISHHAFWACSELTSITLPASITSIGQSAFVGCTGLTSVNFQGTLENWCNITFTNVNSNPLFHARNLSIGGALLTQADIPSTITALNRYAFCNDTALTSVTLPTSVTTIRDSVFAGCSRLVSVDIPAEVTTIGDHAFQQVMNVTYSGSATGSPWGADHLNAYYSAPLLFTDNSRTTLLSCNKGATSVVIPTSVTTVAAHAFEGCYQLTYATQYGSLAEWMNINFTDALSNPTYYTHRVSIGSGLVDMTNLTIPSYVTTIKPYTFVNLTGMTSVHIPISVTSIGRGAFAGCSGLSSVTIPSYVTAIGDSAFYMVRSVTYSGSAAGSPWGALSRNGYVDYPLVYTSSSKTRIVGCATDATSITIPSSVTSIASYAFEGCDNLQYVNYAGSLQGWCYITFESAWANPVYYSHRLHINETLLTQAVIPSTITIIKPYTFYNDTALTAVTIPSSVTSIGASAFGGCNQLTTANYSGTLEGWCNITFENKESNPAYKAHSLHIGGSLLTHASIPSSITEIKPYAFCYNTSLTSVEIPTSVTTIGEKAFAQSGLQSLTLPNSVTEIGTQAFFDCMSLASVTIGNSLQRISQRAFAQCQALTNLNLGDSVTHIDPYAFYLCSGLTSLTIPNPVTTIDENAFNLCTGLNTITLGKSLSSIGYDAFRNCIHINTFYVLRKNLPDAQSDAFRNVPTTATIYAPCNYYVGYGWDNFTNFVDTMMYTPTAVAANPAQGTVTFLRQQCCDSSAILSATANPGYIFDHWSQGTWTSRSNPVTRWVSEKGVVAHFVDTTGMHFQYANIANQTLKYQVISHDDHTCELVGYEAPLPASVTIPSTALHHNGSSYTVVGIGNSAFDSCAALTSVSIPNTVTTIGSAAFRACTQLTAITLPNVLTSIGDNAFKQSGLTAINIPSSVTAIGAGAFHYCASLATVTMTNSVRSIGDRAFSNCSALSSANLSDSVTTINQCLFWGCSSLTSINLPPYIDQIGWGAFNGCSSLSSIHLPNTIRYIQDRAFYGCSSLTSVVIPDSVTYLCQYAFQNCTNLTSVTIGRSVFALGVQAFDQCSRLASITLRPTTPPTLAYSLPYNGVFRNIPSSARFTVPCGSRDAYISAWSLPTSTTESLTFDLTVASSDATRGAAVVTTAPTCSTPAVITATPNEGYVFEIWSDGNTDNPRTLTLTQDTVLTALFVLPDATGTQFTYTHATGQTLRYQIISLADRTCKVIGYVEPLPANLAIPDTARHLGTGYTVTTIGTDCFKQCTALDTVSIPNTVTTIQYRAFYQCTSLESIDFGNSVSTFGNYVFYGCNKLTEVTIPSSVTTIGNLMFCGCTRLHTVHLPNTLTTIGNSAFFNCGFTSLVLPNSVTTIGNSAFRNNSRLTSVTLGDSVTSITYDAFRYCSHLDTVICKSATAPTLGTDAFGGLPSTANLYVLCGSLSSYQTDYSVSFASIIETSPHTLTLDVAEPTRGTAAVTTAPTCTTPAVLTATPNLGFEFVRWSDGNTDNPRTLTLTQDTVLTAYFNFGADPIGTEFEYTNASGQTLLYRVVNKDKRQCSVVGYVGTLPTNLIIPDIASHNSYSYNVTHIGYTSKYPFQNCSTLVSVTLPPTLKYIYGKSFQNCTSLSSINFPDSLLSIYENAFENCTSLSTLNFPDSMSSIGYRAFKKCTGLTSVTLPRRMYNLNYQVFDSCSSLVTVIMPDSIGFQSGAAFRYCTSLTSVTLPSKNRNISTNQFQGCTSLASITIPDKVEEIGQDAFRNCTALTSITLGNRIDYIGKSAFIGCTALTSVTLGSRVSNISDSAFKGCTQLQTINALPATAPYINATTFANVPSTAQVHVSCGSLSTYQSRWGSYFTNIIETPPYAFSVASNNESMGTVAITTPYTCSSDPVIKATAIGDYVFSHWSDGVTDNPRTVAMSHDTALTAIFHGFYHLHYASMDTLFGTVSEANPLPNHVFTTVGSGNTSSYDSPFNNFYKYSTNECLYLASEIGASGKIDTIRYYVTEANSYACEKVNIYMGTTNSTDLSSGFIEMNNLQLVYHRNNTTIGRQTGWETYPLDTPFSYNGNSNLIVVVCHLAISYTSSLKYQCSSIANLCRYRQNDSDANNYSSITGTPTGSLSSIRANIKLSLAKDTTLREYGTEVALTATPNEGYEFFAWSDRCSDNPRTLTVTQDTSVVAYFAPGPRIEYVHDTTVIHDTTVVTEYIHDTTYVTLLLRDSTIIYGTCDTMFIHDTVQDCRNQQLVIIVNNDTLGAGAGAGSFPYGSEVQIMAIPRGNARFVRWSDGNTQNPRTVVLNGNLEFTAIFEER